MGMDGWPTDPAELPLQQHEADRADADARDDLVRDDPRGAHRTHRPSTCAGVRQWAASVGRWEGDTLIVDTTNFTNKSRFRGSSDQLHLVEQFSRLDSNTLLYRFTVEDSATWAKPWTGEYTWAASTEGLFEYACHEANYAMAGILRGARVQEAEKKSQPR